MRELQLGQAVTAAARYTLTYREGTCMIPGLQSLCSIYPHIQWGNLKEFNEYKYIVDIPSHTVRELLFLLSLLSQKRYTLTYSEGTQQRRRRTFIFAIYPHIQWGNCGSGIPAACRVDIPSHTVRERPAGDYAVVLWWYTLTYSEGTPRSLTVWPCSTIHPHIQWGNSSSVQASWLCFDTPSHTVREHERG